jgi:MFS family permease
MQQDASLTLVQGGWLATANYVGYLTGAAICISAPPRPARSVQWGLVSIAVSTLGMAVINNFWLWFMLRFLAGAASAFVLVGVSAWAMPILAHLQKGRYPEVSSPALASVSALPASSASLPGLRHGDHGRHG